MLLGPLLPLLLVALPVAVAVIVLLAGLSGRLFAGVAAGARAIPTLIEDEPTRVFVRRAVCG